MRKPFYKKTHKAWYVHHEGRYIRLGTTEEEAKQTWAKLETEKPFAANESVVVFLNRYMKWVKHHRAERTFEWYHRHLSPFGRHIGRRLKIHQLKPHHVTDWIAKDHANNSPNTVHGAMRAVQRAFSWGVKQGYISKSPVASLEKPQPTRREVYINPEQWQQMMEIVTDEFEKDLLVTMRETGMRTQEIRILEAKHFDESTSRLVLPVKDSKGKRKNRVVYLNDIANAIIKRLCKKHQKGCIFRNSKNKPWTRNAIRLRFDKFKAKLEIPDLCSTAIRHVFTTEALKNGVNPVALAELLGHNSTSMISRHYSHLFQNPEYLRNQAKKATATKHPNI